MATGLLAALFGVVVLLLAGAGALAWRLTQGPVDVTWLVQRAAPVFAPGLSAERVTLAVIAGGSGHELQVVATNVQRRAEGDAPPQSVRAARARLALAPLLTGRIAPDDVALDGLRLHLATPLAGAGSSESGLDPARLLARLQHLSVTDAEGEITGSELGQTLTLHDARAEIVREADGILHLQAAASATSAGVTANLEAEGRYGPDGGVLQATVPSVNPAVLARAIPALASAGALDATLSVHGEVSFGPQFDITHASVHAESGPGTVQLPAKGGGTSPGRFAAMALDAEATPAAATLHGLRLVMVPPSGNPPTTVILSGTAERADGRFAAHVVVDIDHVAFADLGALWPERVGGESRQWLAENLTAGTAHDGHVTFTLAGAETGADLDVTEAGGGVTADDVAIWWLRPVPPVQDVHAVLVWQTPDVVVITATGGREAGIDAKAGTIRLTGLAGHDQVAIIDTDLAGPLADVITLLKHPRLQLLSKRPMTFSAPAGTVTAHLSVKLPLEAKVTMEQVPIHASGLVANTHLGGIAAGRDLDGGQLAFDVTNDGMTINGPAQLSRIPVQLAVQLDFKDGPKTQVLQHVTAGLKITRQDAEKAGLGVIGLDAGSLAATIDYAERRDGTGTIQADADLKGAGFVTPLGWSKTSGSPGHARGRALLDHGRLVGLDGLEAQAPGLDIVGRSELVNGSPSVLHVERGEIGRTDATGTIVLPQQPSEPYRITLAGRRLDLEGRLSTADAPAASNAIPSASSGPGTPYVLDLRFDRVVLGPNHGLGPVSVTAAGNGRRLSTARLVIGGEARARAELTASSGGRRLTASATDLGALLRNTDLADEVVGGQVQIEGVFDDRTPGSPFNGTLDLREFKVRGAPVVGKILQAATLYGVVDALRGPGLAFDRFTTPFRLQGSVLDVEDARAFSASLGLTATGKMDFGRKVVDMHGTIVPAYFFNSLPGRIPLIGPLFSPEKGSGMIAVNYALRGKLTDPDVRVNPLSALTPGFTRRFFDLFD